MRFDDHFLEELKSRLRLSDVIGKSVRLKRQGREYIGLSPFSKEKTPSFTVNDDKGFWHDFSSNKHGDLISFLQETERLSFVEAVERLAAEAGMALPAPDPQAAAQEKARAGLADWLEMAAAWFEAELRRPAGREARAYLERRGLPEAEWARFRLGFSPPGRTALKDYLVAKGAKPGELIEAGLLGAPDDGRAPYDRFSDRIIFPISDHRGRVISFGGRAMDPQARAKYLNGPESPLFSKGRQLYGLTEARKLLQSGGDGAPLVVVEGYMDAIACARAGIAAVATLGTALTEAQMELLWRLHPEPTLSFDGDKAGQRAAMGAVERALPLLKPGRSLQFAIVTGGKDPDDVLREQGPAALKAQLSQTTPFVDKLFDKEKAAAGELTTPERRAALKVALRKAAASLTDPDLAGAYKEALLARYEALWPTQAPVYTASGAGRALAQRRWDGKKRIAPLEGASPEGLAGARELAAEPRPLAAALALAAMRTPAILGDKIEQVGAGGFGEAQLTPLADELVALSFSGEGDDAGFVQGRLSARGVDAALMTRLSRAAGRAHAAFLAADLTPDQARSLWSRAYDALMQLHALERAVESAKQDLERDQDSATLHRLKTDRDAWRRAVERGEWAEGNLH